MNSTNHFSRLSYVFFTILYAIMLWLAIYYHSMVGQPGIILNHGIAFGWLSRASSWLISMGTGLVILILTIGLWRIHELRISVSWILAGATANWTNRILWGGVVDYWQLKPYPYIFNLADVCIRLGTLVLVVQAYFLLRKNTAKSYPGGHNR